MSTRAQDFKAATQRTHHLAPTVKKPRRVIDPKHTDTRNVTVRADKAVGMALEDSMSGRPSRKSSRKSAHHGRSDTQIMKAKRDQSQTSGARAARAQVSRRK
jgi:hypothetical protein